MGTRGRLRLLACIGLLVAFSPATSRSERIISEGDTWRFRNGWAYPYPGTNWTTLAYDDSVTGWFSLISGFGYGDGDDNTVLNDMQNTGTTFYTRKKFVITDPADINYMTLGVDYDDGFVAWINGVEVARRNVNGAVTNTTVATGNHEASRGDGASNPQEKEFIVVTNSLASLLVAGDNVIAVSGHNVSLSSSDASLIVELYTNVTLVRGPFIQIPNSNQVTVVWRTEALTDSVVDYGLDLTYGSTASDATLTNEHVVNIAGLLPGTNYYYRVRSSGVTLWQGDYFKTKRTESQPFRIVIVGDFGAGTPGMSNVAARVNSVTGADLFLTVGDNIYPDGQPGLLDPYWFSQYAPTMRRVPCMPALGNHDVAQGVYSGAAYLNSFYLPTNGPAGQIERNYSFDYGNAHFACFDSNPFTNVAINASVCSAIKTWLSNDLAGTTKQWKIVYFHHPPYTSSGGSAHSDDAGVKTNLWPILKATGVDIAFDGHNHFYERMDPIDGVYEVITGGGGQSIYSPSVTHAASVARNSSVNSFTVIDINGSTLSLRALDASGNTIDQTTIANKPFRMDGIIDDVSWLRAQNGLKLYAAIRGKYLYLATQDAGEGNDHFIYLNNQLSTNRPANWAKAGTVMQWSAFLADENDNHFTGWFGNNEQSLTDPAVHQSRTPGYNNNNTDINGSPNNGVLEGMIDLAAHFGGFPQQLYLAAAPFATADSGALVTSAQVPAGNGNGNIESSEFLSLNLRDIALDLPIANAGAAQTNEAGMTVFLNGTASSSPSGLPLSFNWTQLTGPPVTLVNSNSAIASFAATSNVGANTDLTFQLTVNDTRFDSNAVTTVTLYAMVDSDGDGLSDQEELTGQNNALTPPNPNGVITDPNRSDTDGDGSSDGDEALAGTDPNDPASSLRVTRTTMDGGGFLIQWDAVAGKTYRVQYRNDTSSGWSNLPDDILATTTTTNVVDGTASGQPTRFYRVLLVP